MQLRIVLTFLFFHQSPLLNLGKPLYAGCGHGSGGSACNLPYTKTMSFSESLEHIGINTQDT